MSTWRTPLKARHSRTRRAARGKLESLLVEADDRLGTPLVYERRLVHELVAVLKSDDGHELPVAGALQRTDTRYNGVPVLNRIVLVPHLALRIGHVVLHSAHSLRP